MAKSAECRQYIETNTVAYPCDLKETHEGPHRSVDIPRSVERRRKWEQSQDNLNEFQGKAQTTAERYTVNPTPVPGQETEADPQVYIEDRVQEVPPEENMRLTTSDDFLPRDDEMQVPSKQRPGDQPLPVVREDEGEAVQERIIDKLRVLLERGEITQDYFDLVEGSMEDSIKVGTERYGTPLQTFNGRDVLQDAADEARDLFVYLSQAQQARQEDEEKLVQLLLDDIYQANQEGEEITVAIIVRRTVKFVLDAITVV